MFMSVTASETRYATVQIALHWLIVVLFATNFLISDDMGRALRIKLQGGVPDQFAALVHPPVGLAILVLMVVRIGLRWWLGAPALPERPALMDRLAPLGASGPLCGFAGGTFVGHGRMGCGHFWCGGCA